MLYKSRKNCILCKNNELSSVLELPKTPPANELMTKRESQDLIPLSLMLCNSCGHVQLKEIVPPERLFRKYLYVSGTSPVFIQHFKNAASSIIETTNIDKKDLIVEIGSNDGTLLQAFRSKGYANILGVDPANEIAEIANQNQITTIPEFFDKNVCEKIFSENGKAKLILANNVFAHSEDLIGMANDVSSLLDKEGYFIFEVSYLLDVIDKLLFDTIYHEHLSYHAIKPLIKFLENEGLYLFHVERINSHGGSIRCFASKKKIDLSEETKNIIDLEEEKKLFSIETYKLFGQRINMQGQLLRKKIYNLKKNKKKICGFGAPAKLTTLMYAFDLKSEDFEFIIDDSKFKQGLLTSGMHIPIVSSERLYEDDIDACIVFAWNFYDSIIKKHAKWNMNGKIFINPIEDIN